MMPRNNAIAAAALLGLLVFARPSLAQSLTVTTFAGSPIGQSGSTDGTGAGALFNLPYGLAFDGTGNMYVADFANDTIREITSQGVVTTVSGIAGTSGGVDGGKSVALYHNPTGVVVDKSGNIFVCDRGNHAIREIAPDGTVSTFAGYIGQAGHVDDVGTNARFNDPEGIAMDASGNLYVADGYTIRKITPSRVVTSIAGSPGVSGYADGLGSAAQFALAGALAVDAKGNIFVADGGNLVREVSPGGLVTTVAGVPYASYFADGAVSQARFGNLTGIAVDGAGNIFVSDYSANRIREISGGQVTTVAGNGSYGNTDGTGTGAAVGQPYGLAFDASGNLFVATGNNTIRKAVPSGPPTIGTPPAPQTANAGTTATFKVLVASSTAATYQWSLNGSPIAGATSSSFTTEPAQLSDAGIYSVAVTNAAGTSVSSTSLTVSFAHDPTFSFNSWSASAPLPASTAYVAVAYDGSDFLAIGFDGTAYYSPDGSSWAASPSNGHPGQTWGELNGITNVSGQGMLAACGNGGAIVTYTGGSYDGTLHSSGTASTLTGIAYGGGTLVTVGYGGVIAKSDATAAQWTPESSGTTQNLNAVAYGNGRFVAVGLSGTVVSSADGVTWTAGQLGAATNLYGIAYGLGNFVATGDGGGIFVSADGKTWVQETSPISTVLVHIGFGDGVFVAIGFTGTVLTSVDDGNTWTAQDSGTAQRLDGIALGGNVFVLTGDSGTVVLSAPAESGRIVNLSARAEVEKANQLIAGFVISGSGSKQIVMRGVGPALAGFGVSGALALPDLTLYSSGAPVDTNSSWGGGSLLAQAFLDVGAFPLPAASADAAILAPLQAGAYTSQVSGANGSSGVALAELYDADAGAPKARLVNISARADVGASGNILIAGFVISGNTPVTVLIRGVGPSLAQFGVPSPISAPQLVLYDANNNVLETNAGWGGGAPLAQTFAQVGAFKLTSGSADAAMVVTLPPGAYTAEMSGAGGATGDGLEEIYEVSAQ